MGVKNLHKYLYKVGCAEPQYWCSFRGSTIVVDASIYMYQFKCIGNMCIRIREMVDMLRSYSCEPIFVFDGKPPELKEEEILRRREEKSTAWKKYKECTDVNLIMKLRRDSMSIVTDDIHRVKKVLDDMTVNYRDAEGEADVLCATLVRHGTAIACLSEDSDLLVYGCTTVLRQFKLGTSKIVMYKLPKIMKELRMTHTQFQQICVLSGTDYTNESMDIFSLMKLFHQFKKMKEDNFIDWYSKEHKLPDNYNQVIELLYFLSKDNII